MLRVALSLSSVAVLGAAFLLALALLATPAGASNGGGEASGPTLIGTWGAWRAATHRVAGRMVCYAFTRVSYSTPVLAGRGDVVLTVTERLGGRDAVAISAGFAYPQNAEVMMEVGDAKLPFYTDKRSAFARDGHAAVAAFERGSHAAAHSPAPRNAQVTDTFSLRGFSNAYAAITKACPK